MTKPSKERIKEVLDEVEELDLPDGAYWAMVHEQLGLEYGEVMDAIADDPDYYGYTEVTDDGEPVDASSSGSDS